MAEWSIAAVLKTVDLQGSGGSNPSLSARKSRCPATRGIFSLTPVSQIYLSSACVKFQTTSIAFPCLICLNHTIRNRGRFFRMHASENSITQIERFEQENRSIDKEILSNSLKKITVLVNCNNFQIGVYLSKAIFRLT